MLTGQKIAQLRLRSNMTQEQLAEKLFVTRQLVSSWENGKSRPDYNTVLELSDIFSVKPDEIFNKFDMLLEELSACLPDDYNENTQAFISSVDKFLETLSKRDRSVFVRRYYFFEDTSVIADEYRIKENNVRIILMRTRKKLTKYFKEVRDEKK